jgi:hypothetical protein
MVAPAATVKFEGPQFMPLMVMVGAPVVVPLEPPELQAASASMAAEAKAKRGMCPPGLGRGRW